MSEKNPGITATTTVIKKCTCKHEYQDEKYGKNMRVMNSTNPKMGAGFRCTVCRAKVT